MLASPVSPVFKNADDIQRTGRNSRRLLVLPTDVCVVLVLASGSRPLTAPPHVDPLGPPPRLSEGWFSRPDPIMPHLCQVLQCSAVSKVSFEYLSGTPKALRDRALVPHPNLVFCPRMVYHFSTSSLPSPAPRSSWSLLSLPRVPFLPTPPSWASILLPWPRGHTASCKDS